MGFIAPMLATESTESTFPTSDGCNNDWSYEIKLDGIRCICVLSGGHLELYSRNGKDITKYYPELESLPEREPYDAIFDGELVVFKDGKPSLHQLQKRMFLKDPEKIRQRVGKFPLVFAIFDILSYQGESFQNATYVDRRGFLESLEPHGSNWSTTDVFQDGRELLRAVKQLGYEGVVAKKKSSTYTPGSRSHHWKKVVVNDHC